MLIRPTILTSLAIRDTFTKKTTVTTVSTASAVTYTGTQIAGGLILRNTNGAGRADLFPTASQLYSAFGNPEVGQTFNVIIRNTAGAAETITMTTNTGLTLSGTMTIAQNNQKEFLGVFTSPTAVTIYSLGTVVF